MTRRFVGAVADSGPVVILAGIAAAGSFTHIRDTATEHGQHGWMAWAIAVCIDLTCVMAAGERQRDKRTGRDTGRLSWPTAVLIGGILLSLAANLAQADPSVWGGSPRALRRARSWSPCRCWNAERPAPGRRLGQCPCRTPSAVRPGPRPRPARRPCRPRSRPRG